MEVPSNLTAALTDAALNAVATLWWVIALALLVAIARLPAVKGWFGEASVKLAAAVRLRTRTYRPFHDLVLSTRNGTAQIDHVFVSPYGIFVVETKNMKGWIFGAENEDQWTQKLFRRSYRFQNPLRQNYAHIQALRELLDVPEHTIHSVIAFVGDCRLKTRMPENVVRGGQYIRYIKGFRDQVFNDSEAERLCRRISEGRLASSSATRRQHVEHVKQRTAALRRRRDPPPGPAPEARRRRR